MVRLGRRGAADADAQAAGGCVAVSVRWWPPERPTRRESRRALWPTDRPLPPSAPAVRRDSFVALALEHDQHDERYHHCHCRGRQRRHRQARPPKGLEGQSASQARQRPTKGQQGHETAEARRRTAQKDRGVSRKLRARRPYVIQCHIPEPTGTHTPYALYTHSEKKLEGAPLRRPRRRRRLREALGDDLRHLRLELGLAHALLEPSRLARHRPGARAILAVAKQPEALIPGSTRPTVGEARQQRVVGRPDGGRAGERQIRGGRRRRVADDRREQPIGGAFQAARSSSVSGAASTRARAAAATGTPRRCRTAARWQVDEGVVRRMALNTVAIASASAVVHDLRPTRIGIPCASGAGRCGRWAEEAQADRRVGRRVLDSSRSSPPVHVDVVARRRALAAA